MLKYNLSLLSMDWPPPSHSFLWLLPPLLELIVVFSRSMSCSWRNQEEFLVSSPPNVAKTRQNQKWDLASWQRRHRKDHAEASIGVGDQCRRRSTSYPRPFVNMTSGRGGVRPRPRPRDLGGCFDVQNCPFKRRARNVS